jgi:hypothetical protein
MRQFKARVEAIPSGHSQERAGFNAIEFYLRASNIREAAEYIHDVILGLGFDDDNITKLIDITE